MIRRLLEYGEKFLSHVIPNDQRNKMSGLEYWERRVREYGRLSVLNTDHSEDEFDNVTLWQKSILLHLLESRLNGYERVVLDYGCGTGRFTRDLAKLIQGRAIGVDPIAALIDMAPRTDNVEYLLLEKGVIPLSESSVDVVWICLVLGCITSEKELSLTIKEINRILREDGLLFIIENTTDRPDLPYYIYRPVEQYQSLFTFSRLEYLTDYYDLGERISVMSGRKLTLKKELLSPRKNLIIKG